MEDPGKIEAILRAEWAVIAAAPYSFLAALLFLLIVSWGMIGWIFRWRYMKQIEIKDMVIRHQEERIAIKDEEIAANRAVDKTLTS